MTLATTPALPLALIVAVAKNGVIGAEGTLPWHLPEDLKHFKRTTMGHAIVMGRKTYESIGKPLPGRRNIIVTRGTRAYEGCETAPNLPEALRLARKTDPCPFVIGGASLYEAALPLATEIHMTTLDRDVEGDTFFPTELDGFEEVRAETGETPGVVFRMLRRR